MVALAVSTPALAQGKSQQHKKNPPAPPSRSNLAAPAGVSMPATAVAGPTPFAWVDDASLLEAGSVSIALSVARWQGGGISEVDVPVIDAAIGLTPRVHLTMSVPRVVGSEDPFGPVGGMGTSYFSAKIAALNNAKRGLKLSVAPTLEVLGSGVLQSVTPGERRAHFGLPVSVEIDRAAPASMPAAAISPAASGLPAAASVRGSTTRCSCRAGSADPGAAATSPTFRSRIAIARRSPAAVVYGHAAG